MSGERWRLFVAVAVPDEVRGAVDAAVAPLRDRWPDLRWTRPEGWHLTLAFLGSVEPDDRAPLPDALAAAAADSGPFTVRLTPTAGRSRSGVLWIDADGGEALAALADAVRVAVADLGFEVDERPFRAHLTLARPRGRGRVPRAVADAYAGPAAEWTVSDVGLYRSHLGGRRPARYERVGAWLLG